MPSGLGPSAPKITDQQSCPRHSARTPSQPRQANPSVPERQPIRVNRTLAAAPVGERTCWPDSNGAPGGVRRLLSGTVTQMHLTREAHGPGKCRTTLRRVFLIGRTALARLGPTGPGFFVVADYPLERTDGKDRALLASGREGHWAKRHADSSLKERLCKGRHMVSGAGQCAFRWARRKYRWDCCVPAESAAAGP